MTSVRLNEAPEDDAPEEVLGRVRALRALINESAEANEQATDITPQVIDALIEAGVFRLKVPRVLGGMEAHPDILIDVIREMSYHDGSTGWYAGAVMTAGAVSGALLGDRAIDAIFRSGESPLAAGQAAPTGKAERIGDS